MVPTHPYNPNLRPMPCIWSTTALIPFGHLLRSGTRFPEPCRLLVLQQSSMLTYVYPRSLRPSDMNLFAVSSAYVADAEAHCATFYPYGVSLRRAHVVGMANQPNCSNP